MTDEEIAQIVAEVSGNEVRTDLYVLLAVEFPRRLSELVKVRRYTHLKPNDVTEKLDARRKRTQEAPAEPAGA